MEPIQSSGTPNKAIIGIIVVALLVAAATAVVVLGANNEAKNNSVETTVSSSPAATTESTASSSDDSGSSTYKNGTYTATGSYSTPGGQESIGLSVTLAGDTISSAKVTQNATGGEAEEYQAKFAANFESQVVGKKIDEVSLSRVAGSSLTPRGFNNAITDIENQAKA